MPTQAFAVPGVRLGTARAAIRYPDRRDLVVIEAATGSNAAALFTRNAFCAAPVTVAREHLLRTMPRFLVVNTGNANAGTGVRGLADANATCAALARLAGCTPQQVLPFSTGVIGEPLPMDRVEAGLPAAFAALSPDGWEDAAHGILTTDTRIKLYSRRVDIAGHTITLTGMAKGAGMICPNLATMLAFLATDAALSPALLRGALEQAAATSFNAITVDGDTSTNDACVVLASGQSGLIIERDNADYRAFAAALKEACETLAQELIRDAEGATKFITLQIEQGRDVAECRQVGYTIAHSPLVKTAFFASDPNWGRIVAAIGRAGVPGLAIERVNLWLDDVCIVRGGGRADDYTEERGQAAMRRAEITVRVELGRGEAAARLWTSDLSHDYVRINADYRS